MCGILGVIKTAEDNFIDKKILTSMRDSMFHRGPDGSGIWISKDKRIGLAHRRLSIVDLSEKAKQPMTNSSGNLHITFNGEIYNHMELRENLIKLGYEFKTDHSDTEVIINGYQEWGENIVNKIFGDFAFGIWDQEKETMFLARDRIGVKPLYFHSSEKNFIFASEIKAILNDTEVERDIDQKAMYHYLTFLATPAPFTMFKNIFKLPAGHAMKVDKDGEIKSWQYWDAIGDNENIADEIKNLSSEATEVFFIDEIRKKLRKSIERRMMSDVQMGVFLSGGIDSSTNVALMNELSQSPINTFTVGFKDNPELNELNYANKVSREFSTNHNEILIDEKDMVQYLENLIFSQDEPIADWVCIPLYFVSKICKDSGTKVVQVGEGSDEQFCGYRNYMEYLRMFQNYWVPFKRFVPNLGQKIISKATTSLANLRPKYLVYSDIINRATRNREPFWSGCSVFWESMKKKLINTNANWDYEISEKILNSGLIPEQFLELDTFNIVEKFFSDIDNKLPGKDQLSRMIYSEFKLRLPELLLMRVDKITMSTSLEARVPFLDHELVELSNNIPYHQKIKNQEAKYILKKSVEGIIPDEIIYRKKMGFGAPMGDWLRGEFGIRTKNLVFKSNLMRRGFFNPKYIEFLFEEHFQAKNDNSTCLWCLINLFYWYDYWIDRKVSI